MSIQLVKEKVRHVSSVTHEGKLVIVATDDAAQFWYTVKQDGYEDSYLQTPVDRRSGWEDWKPLALPDEDDDPSVVAQEAAELSYAAEPARLLMRSRYRSAALSAVAPVQLVSALGHVYVFRQSSDGTLLVDRYVLDGMTNVLNPKLQVRYKRSRQKNQPLKSMRKGLQGLEDVDTLDFTDANGQPFFEPSTELLVIDGLVNGWFSVVLVPTTESDVNRWHVFAYQSGTDTLDVVTLRASEEGLFAFRDYRAYDASGSTPLGRPIDGIIRRSLSLGLAGTGLVVTQGPAATRYDLQQEQQTQSGEMQLLKTASRVMLAVPTSAGMATVSFAIAADGTLSELGGTPVPEIIRGTRREVLLPLDTLDAIRAYADASPPPKGTVTGLGRSLDKRTEDRVEVQTAPDAAAALADGDAVTLTGTRLFEGRQRVARSVDGDHFDIETVAGDGLGRWEKQEPERSGLVFDGMISKYELMDDGALRITCAGHGLDAGDDVQIIGPEGVDGSYTVSRVDDSRFVIDGRWADAEAVNLKLASAKRRGIVLDGVGDHVEIPASDALAVPLDQDFSLEAWVKVLQQVRDAPFKDILSKTRDNKRFGYSYALRYLPETRQIAAELYAGNTTTRIESSATVDDEGFHHVALVKQGTDVRLYIDGQLERGGIATVDAAAGESRQITTTDGALYLGCRLSKNNFFKGQIADVRLWKSARTADELRNRMSMPLTGMETSLVGCWRLGAVAEGKVNDISVNHNDGLVRGHAHVAATQLDRTLANGRDEVFRYSNPELVAVSQRATYEESFEFRLDPPPDDASGAEVFRFVHWGRASRTADAILRDDNATQQAPVEPLADDPGWYRAFARVTIPDGMAFLRSFEIEVQETSPASNWRSAEIRRHRLASVSDTITASRADAALALTRLTDDSANARMAVERLAAEEARQASLLIERRQLREDIQGLGSLDLANAALAKATVVATSAAVAYDAAKQVLEAARYDPVNYWCQIRSVSDPSKVWTHADSEGGPIVILMEPQTDGSRLRQLWRFERTTAGTFMISSRWDTEMRCANSPTLYGGIVRPVPKTAGEPWRISKSGSSYTIASAWANTFCVPTVAFGFPFQFALLRDLGAAPDPADPWSHWTLEALNWEASTPDIDTLTQEIERRAAQSKVANAERARLDGIARNLQAILARWTSRLNAVDAELALLEKAGGTLALANAACLEALHAPRAAMGLGVVANAGGLATQAGLLASARAASRVKALATCDGNVQLSYFDAQGCMRLTRYDATSDSRNASAEQWLPDGPRACLNLGRQDGVPVNINIATTPGWTIEAWFWFPLPETDWRLLAGGASQQHVVVGPHGQLGIGYGGFVPSGFDLNGLAPGWHHLAAVGLDDTTLFHIDGKRVGDTRGAKDKALAAAQLTVDAARKDLQSSSDADHANAANAALVNALEAQNVMKQQRVKVVDSVVTLGNASGGGFSFGKIAELRVWGIALSDDEIAANSKTLLSGNEPGLLAYYPLDEGEGVQVHDRTGNSPAATVKGVPNWWGCSAPIGNLGDSGSKAMQFDGSGQCVEVPYAAELNPAQFTVACWARVTGGKNTWRSVLTSRNVGPTRGYILYAGQNNKWQCWIGDGGAASWVVCSTANASADVVPNRWTHLAASFDGRMLTLYVDGLAVASVPGKYASNGPANGRPLRIGGGTTETSVVRYPFAGQIAELCLWNRALTPQEIARTTNTRHRAGEAGLAALWPLSPSGGDTGVAADVIGGRNGQVKGATWGDDRLLPIVPDALLCEEYSTIGQGNVAMMRRFLGYPMRNAAVLLPEQRIELLELKWLGNAQFAPTLLGYIEGAPPVPSENLTMADDYNGAASVELSTSEDVEFKWTRTQDSGLGASIDAFLGGGDTVSVVAAPLGVGTSIETSTKLGFKGNLDFSYQFQNESSVASSSTLTMTDRLELRGTPELTPKFAHLGNRFLPKNVGYALVVSALADVFVTRLARSKRMIGYQVKPVEGMPPDVNTITFMMNPAYTMNGSLDGLTGSAATSDRFFKQVSQLRAEFGSLYPASYYRPREAYELKTQIEKADKQRESYFMNFDVGMVDQLSLNRNIDQGAEPEAVTTRPDVPATGSSTQPADQAGKDFAAKADVKAQETGDAAGKRQDEIKSRIADLSKQTHAAVTFAGWQVKMEDLRIRAGKRNIVNNYVWDADGGLRSESQSFANTVEHSIGGSFTLNAGLGVEAEFEAIVSVELTAQATVNLTQTMTKTETASKGLELVVDLSGLEFRGITDHKDNPILPGEKVDRYRFMSFYLEGSDQNFQDFFSTVVDPEWLASNDEEARALRQARAGKSNKAWRVLHRVTYVERPALMGFGSSRRAVSAAETSDYQLLLDKVTKLEDTLNKLLALKLP